MVTKTLLETVFPPIITENFDIGCQIESIANKQMTESFANMRTLCQSIYYSNNSNSLHVSKELSIIMALLEFCPHSHSKTLLIYRHQHWRMERI